LLAVVDLLLAAAALLEHRVLVQVEQVAQEIFMLAAQAQLELEHHSVVVEVAQDIQAQVLLLLEKMAVTAVQAEAVAVALLHLELLAQAVTDWYTYFIRRK
jgi:hypothetical protein